MFDNPNEDRCDKCGKNLAMIHPWDFLNCHCPDESKEGIMSVQSDKPLPKPGLFWHTDAPKPYIKLDQRFPGIVSLFMYDQETAKALTAMGQTIMRREGRGLKPGERELIAAFVSKLNECNFCFLSHAEAAKLLYGEGATKFLFQEDDYQLDMRMRALLVVAVCVQGLDRSELPDAIGDAKFHGATDEEIHDTVLVASFFSMCNRYVDGLGTTFKFGEPEVGGRGLVKYGYTMGVRRFFREVLPKLWSDFWSRF